MALDKQVESIPFVGGLEQKVDPALVGKDKLLELQNYTFNKNGTLTRREGMAALPGAAVTQALQQAELFAFGSELCAIDNSNTLKTYTPGADSSQMASKGAVPYCSIRKDAIKRTGGYQAYLDSASVGGLSAFVWLDTTATGTATGVSCSVVDDSTGALLVDSLQLVASASARPPRVCVVEEAGGTYFVFAYQVGAYLKMSSIQAGATTLTASASNVCGRLGATANYELLGGRVAVVAYDADAALAPISIEAIAFHADGSFSSVVTLASTSDIPSAGSSCIGIASFDSTNSAVLIGAAAVAKVWTLTISVDPQTLAITVTHAAASTNVTKKAGVVTATLVGSSLQVFSSPSVAILAGVSGYCPSSKFTLSPANVASSVTDFLSITNSRGITGPWIVGKAFTRAGVAMVPVAMVSSLQSTLFVVDSTGAVLAKALQGLYGDVPSESDYVTGFVATVNPMAGDTFSVPAFEIGRLSISSGSETTQQGVSRIRLAFGRNYAATDQSTTPLWHALEANCAYLSGANPSFYDGARVVEAGFHYYPEGVYAYAGDAGAVTGTYQLCALYEWVDGKGQRHQSAPSPAVSITVSSKKINFKVPSLVLGVRAASSSIVVYRTLDGGTTFYRETSVAAPNANNPALQELELSGSSGLNTTDAVLSGNEVLYSPTDDSTAGERLFNIAPPACRAIASHQGRLFVAGLENECEWRYSQKAVDGSGLEWNPYLGGRIPQGHGGITAIGVVDDKLILYTPTRKFVVFGAGPDDAGAGSTYSEPQLLPSDVGCIDQRSLANVPDVSVAATQTQAPGGQMAQSRHGLYLLTRGLSDQYVGSSVEPLVQGSTITSAVLLEDKSQLRFSTAAGPILVYDFLWGQWGTFSGDTPFRPVAACSWGGLYAMVDAAAGVVAQEAPGQYRDYGAHPIVGRIATAWLKPGALNGFQRVWRALLQLFMRSDSRVEVAVQANYQGQSVVDSFKLDSTRDAFGGDFRPVELRYHLARQKCAALQFTITDTPTAAPWRGSEFSGLTLELGIKRGAHRNATQQSTARTAVAGQERFDSAANSYLVPR